MVLQTSFSKLALGFRALASLLILIANADADQLPAKISATFSSAHTSVRVESNYDLSNVVLKFCDGSADYKFDGLRGLSGTFGLADKTLAGVWVKSGDNATGDGPGYGEFFSHTCPTMTSPTPPPSRTYTPAATATTTPTRTPTTPIEPTSAAPIVNQPTPTPTATPSPMMTPPPASQPTLAPSVSATPSVPPTATTALEVVSICYQPVGASEPTQLLVQSDELAAIAQTEYTLGACPEDCMGIPNGGATVDLCGVCGGDNSTCVDCAGVPNGSAKRDLCGVCKRWRGMPDV